MKNNFVKYLYKRFFTPDVLQRESYDAFKELLKNDNLCHKRIAAFQDLYDTDKPRDWLQVIAQYKLLRDAVFGMIKALTQISNTKEKELFFYFKKIDGYIQCLLTHQYNYNAKKSVLLLEENIDAQQGGRKAANLSHIIRTSSYNVPTGFSITTKGWFDLLSYNGLQKKIDESLMSLNAGDIDSLQDISLLLISSVRNAKIPPQLEAEIHKALDRLALRCQSGRDSLLAVRSSGVNEDGPHSFAGQYNSILNVSFDDVLVQYLEVLCSKFTVEALSYRIAAGVSDWDSPMAVLVMEMVDSDVSGVVYTEDPTGKYDNTLVVHGVKGLGEKLLSGTTKAVSYSIDKEHMEICEHNVQDETVSSQNLLALSEIGVSLEEYFNAPQDIEWAIRDGVIWVLQSRPLKITDCFSEYTLTDSASGFTKIRAHEDIDLPLIYEGGNTAAKGKRGGKIHYLDAHTKEKDIPSGSILIVETIPPSLISMLSRCNGVVAKGGSVASHFATICREFTVPLIVSAEGLVDNLPEGLEVTLDAEACKLYRGIDENVEKSIRQREVFRDHSPYYRRIQSLLDFIAPLNLLDPEAKEFRPESCRTLHDIIRYAHEKGVRAMFTIGKSGSRTGYRNKIVTDLPFDLYAINLERNREKKNKKVTVDEVDSTPFIALWKGISHSSIIWADHEYYNWKAYDNAALTDGFSFKNDSDSASYAVCSKDYVNINIKFGYHFTLVDCLCGAEAAQNYCAIRFAGGGGTFEGRFYRLQFIESILAKIGFEVHSKNDVIDAKVVGIAQEDLEKILITLGRMLGTTKLMDMRLKDEGAVITYLNQFFEEEEENTREGLR